MRGLYTNERVSYPIFTKQSHFQRPSSETLETFAPRATGGGTLRWDIALSPAGGLETLKLVQGDPPHRRWHRVWAGEGGRDACPRRAKHAPPADAPAVGVKLSLARLPAK